MRRHWAKTVGENDGEIVGIELTKESHKSKRARARPECWSDGSLLRKLCEREKKKERKKERKEGRKRERKRREKE